MTSTSSPPLAVPPEGAPPSKTRTAIAAPPQWPPEVTEKYEPIRRLGKGGFATVLLARQKATDKEEVLVAIKVVGSQAASQQEHGYAHREIDILQELQHPNIMKVYDFWEAPPTPVHKTTNNNSHGCAAVMALSYSRGPTLEHLLKHGGAVSLSFGRVVMAQLVDAIAYCHGRAVIHRDIKPDNVVITGASARQDEIWNDTSTTTMDSEGTDITNHDEDEIDWKKLRQKWHVTLIDFGFARALSPSDIEKEKITMKAPKQDQNGTGLDHSSSSRRSLENCSRHSVSHVLTRKMSALGNRMYAAPEIVNGVQNGSKHGSSIDLVTSRHIIDITKTLSCHVSNYGMLADAFSLGNTLQYMMTGVPPNQNVMETIRNHRSPLMVMCRYVEKHCCGGATAKADAEDGARKYQYRTWSELPKELVTVIRGMNHPAVSQRISVRAARRYPCVEDVFGDDEDEESLKHCTPGRIDFLQCVLKDHHGKKTKPQPPKPASLGIDNSEVGAVTVIDETIVQDDQVGLDL